MGIRPIIDLAVNDYFVINVAFKCCFLWGRLIAAKVIKATEFYCIFIDCPSHNDVNHSGIVPFPTVLPYYPMGTQFVLLSEVSQIVV